MRSLPWCGRNKLPLFLAPMQGLTNSALRQCYMERYEPDVLFTEFVRVNSQSRKRIGKADLAEIAAHRSTVPLVVQLIGNSGEALAEAAQRVQDAGCEYLNLNLGCPYGRMTTGATGGELLREPEKLAGLLRILRREIKGSFSVKCRAGYDDPRQLFSLLPVFSDCGIDFLILHPRTVQQKYEGTADHNLTAEAVSRSSLPIIANGDITSSGQARQLLAASGAAGLMLGRGALADPLLFKRIRKEVPDCHSDMQRRQDLFIFISDLVPRYLHKFCGERQALMKLKDVLNFIPDPSLQRDLGKLKRTVTLARFMDILKGRFADQDCVR